MGTLLELELLWWPPVQTLQRPEPEQQQKMLERGRKPGQERGSQLVRSWQLSWQWRTHQNPWQQQERWLPGIEFKLRSLCLFSFEPNITGGAEVPRPPNDPNPALAAVVVAVAAPPPNPKPPRDPVAGAATAGVLAAVPAPAPPKLNPPAAAGAPNPDVAAGAGAAA